MYCFLNNNLLPSDYIKLPQRERAFIIACVQTKLDEEKKQQKKLKMKKPSRGRRK